jgi:hypothetical protein
MMYIGCFPTEKKTKIKARLVFVLFNFYELTTLRDIFQRPRIFMKSHLFCRLLVCNMNFMVPGDHEPQRREFRAALCSQRPPFCFSTQDDGD